MIQVTLGLTSLSLLLLECDTAMRKKPHCARSYEFRAIHAISVPLDLWGFLREGGDPGTSMEFFFHGKIIEQQMGGIGNAYVHLHLHIYIYTYTYTYIYIYI